MLAFLTETGEWNHTLKKYLPWLGLRQSRLEYKKKIINKSIAYPHNIKDKGDRMI